MKEIRLRCWDVKVQVMNTWEHMKGCYIDVLYSPEDFLIMQYIDLKDSNGKFYCQDDIVRYRGKNCHLKKGSYMFYLLGFNASSQDIPHDFFSEDAYKQGEIIGNIYQNPELLKEKKND